MTSHQLYSVVEKWHDVVLFLFNLVLIAPLTAALLEIYDRREKSHLRNSVILSMNSEIVALVGKFTMGYQYLSFVEIYDALADSEEFSRKQPRDEESKTFVPAPIDSTTLPSDGFYERDVRQSIHCFRGAEKSCETLRVHLAAATPALDSDELMRLLAISAALGHVADVSDDFCFFLENLLNGRKSRTVPPRIRHELILEEWKKLILDLGKTKQKHWRLRFADWVSRNLGWGTIFPDLDEQVKQRLVSLLNTVKGTGQVDINKQSALITKLTQIDIKKVRGPFELR